MLELRFGGKNISEVLEMPVVEAEQFFGAGEARTPAAHAILTRLADVGLGYLSLGQPLTTLSGGASTLARIAASGSSGSALTTSANLHPPRIQLGVPLPPVCLLGREPPAQS